MSTLDDNNPAVSRHIQVPPALLEAVVEDPTAAQPIFRAKAVLMAHELYNRRGNMTSVQQMQLMETFSKMGNLNPKPGAGEASGSGFSINIVLSGQPNQAKTVTVEPQVVEAD